MNKPQINIQLLLRQSLLFLLLSVSKVHSTDLLNLYYLAYQNDPSIQKARVSHQAQTELISQVRSNLLPHVSLSNQHYHHRNPSINDPHSHFHNTTLSIKQPIFKPNSWSEYHKTKSQIAQSNAELSAAEQSLMIKVAQQYFNNLEAAEQLQANRAQKLAFIKQLEQVEERFKVGMVSITDVHQAKAKRDTAIAEEMVAENALFNQTDKLREMIGHSVTPLHTLKDNIDFPAPPQEVEHWIRVAKEQNHTLQAARHQLQVAQTEIKTQQADHFPSIDMISKTTRGNTIHHNNKRKTASSIGIEISWPLFNGGLTSSKVKTAHYNYQKANQELEEKQRAIESDIRQAYHSVLAQIQQIQAFKQVLISSRHALQSTQEAFQVGNKTVTDVFNAHSAVLQANYYYTKARYHYLISRLKLHHATGILTIQDLEYMNQLLSPTLERNKG